MYARLVSSLAIILTCAIHTAVAQQWEEHNPAHRPSPRGGHSLTTVDDVIYLFGGFNNQQGNLNDLWRWDADAGDWVELDPANPPTARFGHAGLAADGRLWILFGQDGTADGSIWVYDPATNAWSDMTSQINHAFVARDRVGATVVTIGGEEWIVFTGGRSFFFELLAEGWALNPATLELRPLPDLPEALWGHIVVPVRSSTKDNDDAGIYVGGGRALADEYERRQFLRMLAGEDFDDTDFLPIPSEDKWPAIAATTETPDGDTIIAGGGTDDGPVTDVRRVRVTYNGHTIEVSDRFLAPLIGEWGEFGAAMLRKFAQGAQPFSLAIFGGFNYYLNAFDNETMTLDLGGSGTNSRTLAFPAANGRGGTPGDPIEWTTATFGLYRGMESCRVIASTSQGGLKQNPLEIPLEPGDVVWYDDVLSELFDVEGTFPVYIEGDDDCLDNLVLVSRIASSDGSPGAASQGQGFQPLDESPEVCAGDPPATLLGLRSGGGWRSNLGFIPVDGMPVSLDVTLYDADSSAMVGSLSVELAGDTLEQVNRILEQVAADVRAAVAEVAVASAEGCARVYGSAISPSQDPTTLEVGKPHTMIIIPAVAHADGGSENMRLKWRTDLYLRHPGPPVQNGPVTVELGPSRKSAKLAVDPVTIVLQPGEIWWSEDVLGSVFNTEGSTYLEISATGEIVAASRTYSVPADDLDGPSNGQGIPPVAVDSLFGAADTVVIPGLRRSADPSRGFRSNIGFENPGSAPLELEIELYGDVAMGSKALLGQVHATVAPGELRIVTDIYSQVTAGDVDRGYALVSTATVGASYFVFGSVVDNQTGDATYVQGK